MGLYSMRTRRLPAYVKYTTSTLCVQRFLGNPDDFWHKKTPPRRAGVGRHQSKELGRPNKTDGLVNRSRAVMARDAALRRYRFTLVGGAIASLSAGSASRASTRLAIALKLTFPILASSPVKV